MLLMCADAQKTFTLRERKGLITTGFFKYTRNPNYMGDIMIYSSFVLLVNEPQGYVAVILAQCLAYTVPMYRKEQSNSKKEGWNEYKQRTWLILPKINGRTLDSLLIYSALLAICWTCYTNGGIETSIKKLIAGQMKLN